MKRFWILVLFALLIRLIAFPYTGVTNEGDSVPRIFIAWQWMEDPKLITHGGWPPLHFYLIAGSLWLWFDPVRTPSILHILFSIATAIPLYGFVRREWGESGALFTAAAFLFYPLSWHLSFLAPSEVPFVFFVSLAMYFLARARAGSRMLVPALAGVAMTLAGAVRFEAWALIPFFGVVLWGRWNALAFYLICGSVFPLFWMTGNVLHGLAPISHMTALREWDLKVEAINEGLNAAEVLRRIIYFPAAVFFGLTPPIAVACGMGAWITWKDRGKRLWLLPITALFLLFVVQVVRGLGDTMARFSLILGFLFLPFSAALIEKYKNRKWIVPASVLCIALMLPLSYSRVVLHRLGTPDFANPFPADLQAIPKISVETKAIAGIVRNETRVTEGLLLDFFAEGFHPWKDTYSAALLSRHHPSRIFIMPGGRYEPLNERALATFFQNNPAGVLVYAKDSRFIEIRMQDKAQARIRSHTLLLQPVQTIKSMTIYRYQVSGSGAGAPPANYGIP